MTGRPLVFLSCGATTAPLISRLASWCGFVVPDAAIARQLTGQGVEAIDWPALADPVRLAEIPARATRLAREWRDALTADPAFLAFGGRTRAETLVPAIDELLAKQLANQLAVVECGRSLAASGRLVAAVVHEDVTGAVRGFLEVIRRFGVATVHVPHGLYAEDRMIGADVHATVHTDVVALAGSVARDWFLRRGAPPARLVVTGNPAWDHLCRQPRLPSDALGLAPGRVVTVATTWIGADCSDHAGSRRVHERQLVAILRAVASLQASDPTLHLVMKLHPSTPPEDEVHLRRLAADAGASPAAVLRDRLPIVLAASDVLVTLPSTIAVEALVVGTPVVATDFFYDGEAVRTVAAEPEAIAAEIGYVLGGWGTSAEFARHRRDFLVRHNGPSDGRAAERVAAVVEDLIARTRPRRAMTTDATLSARLASARAMQHAGRPNDALALLETGATNIDPPALEAERLALRGEALSRLGRAADAERSFRSALAAGAGGRAMAGLGLMLLERGAHAEAEVQLRQALSVDAACDWAWCGLGVLEALRGNRNAAVPLLERALALNPQNADARNALAVLARQADAPARDDAR